MSRPRIAPYERVQTVSVPQFVYPSVPADYTCLSKPPSVAPINPQAVPVRIQPDPFRDEQGPDFLRRVYYSDGSARLLHTEHGETHEVAYVLPGTAHPGCARLYYPDATLPYLLEGVSKQELAWLQGQPADIPETQPSSLPTRLSTELDPYRRPNHIDPTPDLLKRLCWSDGTTRLYLTEHNTHEVNEVVEVAAVGVSTVALHLRDYSRPYYLDDVSIDEYKWLKESVGIRT